MNKKHIAAFTIAATAVFGFAGCAGNSAQEAADHAAANPVVTKTAPPKPAVTVTKQVPVVPQTCLDALDDADQAISTAGDGFNILADALTAAGNFDVAGIEDATTKLTTMNTDQLTPALAAYKTARDTCKAAQ